MTIPTEVPTEPTGGVTLASYGEPSPLTWVATFAVPGPFDVSATFTAGDHVVAVTGDSESPFLVKGLHADTTYTASFRLTHPTSGDETVLSPPPFTTDPLPDDFPLVVVNRAEPDRVGDGYTVLLAKSSLADGVDGYFLALDETGQVAWYLSLANGVALAHWFSDQTLVTVMSDPGGPGGPLEQMNLEGESIGLWGPAGGAFPGIVCDAPGFHHDVIEHPLSNNWVALMREAQRVNNFPVDYDSNQVSPAYIQSDSLFSFDPTTPDCTPSEVIPVGALLDPHRIGFDSLDTENPESPLYDYGHGNAVWVDERDGGYLVSLRNQDAVVKVRDGALVWILGNHDNWDAPWVPYLLAPGAGLEWQYRQHSPQMSPALDGRMLVMDNGDLRISPFTGQEAAPVEQRYSRVVEFQVDEVAGTVEQTWELRTIDGGSILSPFVGDADYLDNGHVLVTWGYVTHVNGVANPERGWGERSVRVMEVSYADPDDVVLDVELYAPQGSPGWTAYRGQRVTSLYAAP